MATWRNVLRRGRNLLRTSPDRAASSLPELVDIVQDFASQCSMDGACQQDQRTIKEGDVFFQRQDQVNESDRRGQTSPEPSPRLVPVNADVNPLLLRGYWGEFCSTAGTKDPSALPFEEKCRNPAEGTVLLVWYL